MASTAGVADVLLTDLILLLMYNDTLCLLLLHRVLDQRHIAGELMVVKYCDQALESSCVVKLCTSLVYLPQGTDYH
jgi:hypothetical protein